MANTAISLYVTHNNCGGAQKFLARRKPWRSAARSRPPARCCASHGASGSAASSQSLSPLLEGWLNFGDDNSALCAALQLPSLVAAAEFCEQEGILVRRALASAEKFAMTDYLTALAGKPPQGDAGKALYKRVADITGLTPENMAQSRGFVNDFALQEPAHRQDRQPL